MVIGTHYLHQETFLAMDTDSQAEKTRFTPEASVKLIYRIKLIHGIYGTVST